MDNLATTIATIVAVCAIVSPIAVAIINNRYNIKMKKMEITRDFRLKAIENYLTALESVYHFPNRRNESTYNSALGTAKLYVSNKARKEMTLIDEALSKNIYEENSPQLAQKINDLCALLQKEIDI